MSAAMGAIMEDRVARFVALIESPGALEEICARVAEGEPLHEIAKAKDLPYSRLSAWIGSDSHRLASYEGALRIRAGALVDESIAIADGQRNQVLRDADGEPKLDEGGKPILLESSVERDKLAATHRLRVASLWDRQRFGDGIAGAGVREVKVTIVQVMGAESAPGESHVGTDTPQQPV